MNPAFNSGQSDGVQLLGPTTWGSQSEWVSHQVIIVHCRKEDYTVYNANVERGVI